ncbi:CheR family methyltransferase [Granulosicoccus sp. 3-233]|uniref:CheR family methyltransferase n=1 Tax=Granulosicoccus sp. 3-233 TaxID=3417969 RepID=UPI003D327C57
MADNNDSLSQKESIREGTELDTIEASAATASPRQALGGDPSIVRQSADVVLASDSRSTDVERVTPQEQDVSESGNDVKLVTTADANDVDVVLGDEEVPSVPVRSPVLYVGIGASAGGLEALRDFFDHMSADSDAGFIVVQHLSPDFESLMDELLARNTSMAVENVVHGVEVLANTIYLIPPKKNITLVDGCLYLSEQVRQGGVNLPIDHFFRSLATDAKHRAVGIILSGTGSDGSRGIKSIKEAGGLILVQDRESAKFDGMPFNAEKTGTADFVLPPEELAVYLSTFLKNSMVRGVRSVLRAADNNEESVLSLIFSLLKTNCGIDFGQYKATTVARRIERRMGINQVQSQFDYLNILQTSKTELETLGRELLINVTSFFRDEAAWDYLAAQVINPLVEQADENTELRFWVAGCSTGEEAYSLAIVIDEAIREFGKHLKIKIFATDADVEAIAHASTARYREEIAHDVSNERLARYFIRAGMEYEIRPDIRKTVVFATHNMINDPPFSNIDLITCRNVLIYFQQAVQRVVMSAFHFSLKDKARVFFGSSESVGELKTHYKVLHERFRVYEKITNTRLPISSVNSAGSEKPKLGMRPVSNLLRSYRAHSNNANRFEHVKDHLINDFVPSCLILNSEHQAMHLYGDANKYLIRFPVGRVSTNIHEIIVEELSVALDTALSRSKTESKPVNYSNIQTTINDQPAMVDMQVEYFPDKGGMEAYYSVVLMETNTKHEMKLGTSSFDYSEETQQRIRDLENELLHKQEHLQVANEELETTNEELQAANEELMSSNEELQSTNEELQSVNEELYTVNCEHQEKIEELMTVNDDMDNILVATSVGIIFLDEEMLIRKYTSVAAKYFNLLLSDVGRPLHHISNELEYSRLFEDIETVSRTSHSVYREVFTAKGAPVQIKLLPYSSSTVDRGKASAVTITITDLSPRLDAYEDHRAKTVLMPHGFPGQLSPGIAKIRILVVDDSESDRRVIKRHLSHIKSLSVETFEADDIKSALHSLRNDDIDVCLIDYRLGVETADDLSRQITEHNSQLPVILMSGYSRHELEDRIPDNLLMYFLNKSDMSALLLELSIRHAINSSSVLSPMLLKQ